MVTIISRRISPYSGNNMHSQLINQCILLYDTDAVIPTECLKNAIIKTKLTREY